ncbi:hypothetical protein B0T26DRAFT_751541 [Lasiosphaeria miniovina]|uniref:Uncharacterized protein n=1 Tax=Lasiosphaeria miniovina TaxID=1954250 RepID=A0AA40AKF5_9PEZI|nr:uncharacterized protein B0T26DRAFT_751541 [Lasiosphaeria miniovina]KAK0717491.1 hypothetical protein B0T26DRAFT_751541 [Lasiosphaeria miniovina]
MASTSSSANKPEGSLGPVSLREKYPELDDMTLQEIHLQDVNKANLIRDKAIELIRKAAATSDENVADELPAFDYELKRAEDFLVAAEAYRKAPKTSRDDDVAFLSFRSDGEEASPDEQASLPGSRHMLIELSPGRRGRGDGRGRPVLYYWPSRREKAARMKASGGEEDDLPGPRRGSSGPKSAPTTPDNPEPDSENGENTEPESEASAKVKLSVNLLYYR